MASSACVLCSDSSRVVFLSPDKYSEKNQKRINLFKRYGGILIQNAAICRNCLRRLDTLHAHLSSFKALCQRALMKSSGSIQLCNQQCATAQQQFHELTPTQIFSTVNYSTTCASAQQQAIPTIHVHNNQQKDSMPTKLSSTVYGCTTHVSAQQCGIHKLHNIQPKEPTKSSAINNSTKPTNGQQQVISIESTPIKHTSAMKDSAKRKLFQTAADHSYSFAKSNVVKTKKIKKHTLCSAVKHTTSHFHSLIAEYSKTSDAVYISNDDYNHLKTSLESKNISYIVETIHNTSELKDAVLRKVMRYSDMTSSCGNRLHGDVSILMKKDYTHLKEFNWGAIVEEAFCKFPVLIKMMLAVSVGEKQLTQEPNLQKIIPKLGLIIGILLQARHHDLSLVQRSISVVLFDSISDQKVYDRLQPLGVCLCHKTTNDLLETIGGHFHHEMIELVKNKRRFRLIGDNVNWKQGVSEERLRHHAHMVHTFGSLVIEQTLAFNDVVNTPRQPFYEVKDSVYLLNQADWEAIKLDYIELMGRVADQRIPCFPYQGTLITGPYTMQFSKKNKVIPLPLLFRNEQKYSDVVKILDFYEDTVKKVYEEAGVTLGTDKILIGGDQLTRERFSGAKRLRLGGIDNAEKFDHLGPITFEFFHLMMNLLILIFKTLHSADSIIDLGTIMCEKVRVNRSNVSDNVRECYDENKDFFISLVDSYIIEAIMDHFGMEDVSDTPTKHRHEDSNLSRDEWFKTELGHIVDQYVAPTMAKTLKDMHEPCANVEVDGEAITLGTHGTTVIDILMKTPSKQHMLTDEVLNHGKRILELGMIFKNMLDLISLPDKDRGLCLLKYIMLIFRSDNTRSKYAYEIMRLLVHQYVVLSERDAHREFYSLFVNTNGKVGGNVAADDRMEWHVGVLKQHIRHMVSNKIEQNISNKSRALGGVNEIANSYDMSTHTIVRSKKHSIASSSEDEVAMLKDLRGLRPFSFHSGNSSLACTCNRQPT